MRRNVPVLLALLLCAACRGTVPSPDVPRPVKVLSATPEAETGLRTERRSDLDVRTETGERQPLVVAKGETGPLRLPHGVRALLAGDEAAKVGFEVDNFILFEVVVGGEVKSRFAVGYHDGLTASDQEVEAAGKAGMRFEATEVDVTNHLPEPGTPFVLRATALDYGNVGRVSDVWIIFAGQARIEGESWRD